MPAITIPHASFSALTTQCLLQIGAFLLRFLNPYSYPSSAAHKLIMLCEGCANDGASVTRYQLVFDFL